MKCFIKYIDKETGEEKTEVIHLTANEYHLMKKNKTDETKWREAYFQKHQEKYNLETEYDRYRGLSNSRQSNIDSVVLKESKVGRKGKFETEQEFHKAVLSIQDWDKLSKNKLAQKLGYTSSSGLNDLLKSKNWELP